MSRKIYIGFYWTLPVPWVQFDTLPKDADAAAKASRTIRYQRDLVRRWIRDEGGTLVAERVFLELAPDRASEHVNDAVRELAKLRKDTGAEIVHVRFQERHDARPHRHLAEALSREGLPETGLHPDATMMDGEEFDPIAHFRAWKTLRDAHIAGKPGIVVTLKAETHLLREAGMSWKQVAEDLNTRGVRTLNGKPWTADNVRKFCAV
jgi:hypothetical protein